MIVHVVMIERTIGEAPPGDGFGRTGATDSDRIRDRSTRLGASAFRAFFPVRCPAPDVVVIDGKVASIDFDRRLLVARVYEGAARRWERLRRERTEPG